MEVPDGSAVTLTASITGTAPATTYAWTPPVGAGVSDSGAATLAWTFNGATDAGTYTVTATDNSAVDSPKQGSIVLTPQQNAGDLWTSCITTSVAADGVLRADVAIGSSGRVVVAYQYFPVGGAGTDVPVIQCFNPQGDVLWSRRIGVDTLNIQRIFCAIDDSNNCYIAVFSNSFLTVWAFGATGTLLWSKTCSTNRFNTWSSSYYDSALNRWIIANRDDSSITKHMFTAFDLSNGNIALSRELTVPSLQATGIKHSAMCKNAAGNYIITVNITNFPDGQSGTLLIETDTAFTSVIRQVRIPAQMSNHNVITDASNNVYIAVISNKVIVLNSAFAHVKTIQHPSAPPNGIRGLQRDLDGSIWALAASDQFSGMGYDATLWRFNADFSQLLLRMQSRVSQDQSATPWTAESQWVNFARGKFVRASGNYSGTGTRGKLLVTCENLPSGDWRRRSSNGISGTEFLDSLSDSTPFVEALDVPITLVAHTTATLGSAGITVSDSGIGVVDGAGQFDRRRHTLQDNITFLLHCNSAGAGNGGVQTEDNSGQRITLTRNSTGAGPGTCFIDNAQSVFGGYSLRLNGTDSDAGHLTLGANGLSGAGGGVNLSNGIPWTIEWRARHDTLASSQAYFGNTARTGGLRMVNSTTIEFSLNGNIRTFTIPALVVDTWYAFALTHIGASPWTVRLHIDGVQVATSSMFTNFDLTSGFIGRWAVSGAAAYPMKGYMDEIRITYGIARYTEASYTPAAAPFVGFGD